MTRRPFGSTGLTVPALGFGCTAVGDGAAALREWFARHGAAWQGMT